MVLVGAKPVAKSYEDTATRLNKLAKAREIKVKDDILDWASNQLTVLTRKGFTSSDLPDSFYEKLSQRMAEHNITAKSLEERVERSQKTKTLEAVLRSDKMNRLDLYNRVEEAGQAFGTNFLQPQR
jgi:hypothetical protein